MFKGVKQIQYTGINIEKQINTHNNTIPTLVSIIINKFIYS